MSSTFRPRRSCLYMPGSNARALDKARGLPADVLILDLEDAVAPEAKAQARTQVAAAVKDKAFGHREVVVRINALDSVWGRDDMAAIVAAKPDAVLVPKVSGVHDLATAAAAAGTLPLWAMIETPLGLLDARHIAAAASSHRLLAFVLGTNDIAKDTGARLLPGRAPMLALLSLTLVAARAFGLAAIDGVFNDIGDEAGLKSECAQGRDLGFDGKTLIHPGQIAIANDIFAPDAAEVAWAKKVIAAFEQPENAGAGALRLEGRMVERLHAEMARRTVAIAQAIDANGGTA